MSRIVTRYRHHSRMAKDERVVIIGGPSTGKTTLANKMKLPRKHTDAELGRGWSGASDEVKKWFDEPGSWVIEGAAAVRGMRKWMKENPGKKPADRVVYLEGAREPLNRGQRSMAKGVKTIYAGMQSELKKRGVKLEQGGRKHERKRRK